jgi:hypothetical protein
VVRGIFTPWSFVVGQIIWSLASPLYLRWSMKKQTEITWWSDILWILCVAQAAGAVAFNIRDCVVGVEAEFGCGGHRCKRACSCAYNNA